MNSVYNPLICDLCSSDAYSTLLEIATEKALRSDRYLVERSLKKLVCNHCGLVRSGWDPTEEALLAYYVKDYTLSTQPEHYFYTSQGQVSRSQMLCEWMISAMGAHRWSQATRCLEIGAGSGLLLQEFRQRFPKVNFEGIELNQNAVRLAQQRALPVVQSSLDEFTGDKYDIIYSVAVIEHVSSPSQFLSEIHKRLKPGGWLFLCQPIQDVSSYDLFFDDHLHHFGSQHLRQYARKCGFREWGLVIGHEWMPNFSLHLWQSVEQTDEFTWVGPAGYTTCSFTAAAIMADITALNKLLVQLSIEQRRIAVFGLNEVYWLMRAYSRLADYPISCGLDDTPDKPEYARLDFPVVTPEASLTLDVQDVILTMNKIYYPQVCQRLSQLGLTPYPILS